jgi:hypothetical protein
MELNIFYDILLHFMALFVLFLLPMQALDRAREKFYDSAFHRNDIQASRQSAISPPICFKTIKKDEKKKGFMT